MEILYPLSVILAKVWKTLLFFLVIWVFEDIGKDTLKVLKLNVKIQSSLKICKKVHSPKIHPICAIKDFHSSRPIWVSYNVDVELFTIFFYITWHQVQKKEEENTVKKSQKQKKGEKYELITWKNSYETIVVSNSIFHKIWEALRTHSPFYYAEKRSLHVQTKDMKMRVSNK